MKQCILQVTNMKEDIKMVIRKIQMTMQTKIPPAIFFLNFLNTFYIYSSETEMRPKEKDNYEATEMPPVWSLCIAPKARDIINRRNMASGLFL